MKTFAISSNVSVAFPATAPVTFDACADFEQIVLRVSSHNRAVNVRVSELGNALTVERVTFGAFGGIEKEIVRNEEASAVFIRETVKNFLGI